MQSRASFTLIELLVVIAILAVLATAVVLVLNPAEMVKAARDSTRLSDLAALNKALVLLQGDNQNASLGSATVVSVSIPDTSPTCANLGLPTLPTGYTYHCAPTSTLTRTDGTGWVPVDLTQFSAGAILSKLPIDPINTSSTGNYYTYIPGGSWHLATSLEATKNKMGGANDKVSTDKGKFPSLYELGTNLTLLPLEYGDTSLIGYWPLDEMSGSVVSDYSGKGNNGNIVGSITKGSIGKINKSFSWNSIAGGVLIPATSSFAMNSYTVSFWINPNITGTSGIVGRSPTGMQARNLNVWWYGTNRVYDWFGNGSTAQATATSSTIPLASWTHVGILYNGSSASYYINGIFDSSWNITNGAPSSTEGICIGCLGGGGNNPFDGYIDDVRIYNRVLSAAEVAALYASATK